MAVYLENEIGKIIIEDQTIAKIAGITATECYGLVGMAPSSTTDGLVELLKGENVTKGVKVHVEEEANLIIDLYVIMQFGTKISAVAKNVIETVKYNVETYTGLSVFKVNIHVQGVRIQNN